MTSLILACFYGHKDIVQLLLKHHERIELNAKTNGGTTAFMLACYYGHKDVVKLLVDRYERIDLNAKDSVSVLVKIDKKMLSNCFLIIRKELI